MNTELLIIQSTQNFSIISLTFIMVRFKIRKSPKSIQKIYFNLLIEEIKNGHLFLDYKLF